MKLLKYLLIPIGLLFFLMLIYSLGTYDNKLYFILKHSLMFATLGSLVLVSQFLIHDYFMNRYTFKQKEKIFVNLSIGVVGLVLLFVLGNAQLKLVEKETPYVVACDYYLEDHTLLYQSYSDVCATVEILDDGRYSFVEDVWENGVGLSYTTVVQITVDEDGYKRVESEVYEAVYPEDNDIFTISRYFFVQQETEYRIVNTIYTEEGRNPFASYVPPLEDLDKEEYIWRLEGIGTSDVLLKEERDSVETLLAKGEYSHYNFTLTFYEENQESNQYISFFTAYNNNSVTLEERDTTEGSEKHGHLAYEPDGILESVKEIEQPLIPNNSFYQIQKGDDGVYLGASFFYRVESINNDLIQVELLLNTSNLREVPDYLYDKEPFDEFDYMKDLIDYSGRARRFLNRDNPILNQIFKEGK